MAWPTTKASNQYTDSGQDRIADARAEINQNITNVNAIIDEFNISSPSDGDLLQYSSSTGKWEQVATSSITSGLELAYIFFTFAGEELVSGDIYRRQITVGAKSSNFVNNNGSYQITLDAGTYFFQTVAQNSGFNIPVTLYNETDAVEQISVATFTSSLVTNTALNATSVFTIASSKNFSFRQETASASERNTNLDIIIHKFA